MIFSGGKIKHMEDKFITLSYYDAITNEEIFDEEKIGKYLRDFQKNKGTLQKNLRDIVQSAYKLVYQDVEWCGRGKNRTLKIGKKFPIAQVPVNKNTHYSTVINTSLIVLLLNDKIVDNKKISDLSMTTTKWLKEAGIITSNFSFIYRDDVMDILETTLSRYIGEENSDVVKYAIWFYENKIRMFLSEEFKKIENFLENYYNISMISEERWNLNDEYVINLYANELVKIIKSRQSKLTKKNIEHEMFINWKEYNSSNKKIVPVDLKSLILDYPLSQIKRNINKSIHIKNSGLGAAERISFDIENQLAKSEYEEVEELKNTTTVNKKFYRLIKRIKPSEIEKEAVETPLSEFRSEKNFDIQRLIYDKTSEESRLYRLLEENILNELGYEKKYSLKLFEEASVKEAISNDLFIIIKSFNGELRTVPISLFNKGKGSRGNKEAYAKEIIKNILTEEVQELQNAKTNNYLKKIAKKNKAWTNIKNQKQLDESLIDLMYVLLLAINDFFNNSKNLPTYTINDPKTLRRRADKTILFDNESIIEYIESALQKGTIQHRINYLEERTDKLSEDSILQLNSLKEQRIEALRAYNILENIKAKLIKV